jgi:hypothetical protein
MKQQFKIVITIIIILHHELGPDRPVAASVLKYMPNLKSFMFTVYTIKRGVYSLKMVSC